VVLWWWSPLMTAHRWLGWGWWGTAVAVAVPQWC